jgi:amidophosphoribosyltransferase
VLLNVLAHELQKAAHGTVLDNAAIFKAVRGVHQRVRGAYAVVVMIAGYGLLAFRDPFGIRPLVLGKNATPEGDEWMLASESVALDTLGFEHVGDVTPGEAVYIDLDRNMVREQCAAHHELSPCLFEYVYLARPDSTLDAVSVYETRLRMGETLAVKVRKVIDPKEIDVVIPIPDSSRPAALQMAQTLGIPFREGFVKNRYIGRTFIMPGQSTRKKSVRQKLNTVTEEFAGKNVMLVDDSIVRGTTSHEIVEMARAAGAKKVFFASASPPVRFPNVYGIDMPTRSELIATGRTDAQIAALIGADELVYQDLDALEGLVRECNPQIGRFDASCFNGCYITGDVDEAYLDNVERSRNQKPVMPAAASDDDEESGNAAQQIEMFVRRPGQ